ncbi:hypothetical protein ACOMHN_064011 [Nucella lapillus]
MHYSSTAQSTTLQPSILRYCLRVPKTQLPTFQRTEHLSTSPHTQGKRPAHTPTCRYKGKTRARRMPQPNFRLLRTGSTGQQPLQTGAPFWTPTAHASASWSPGFR